MIIKILLTFSIFVFLIVTQVHASSSYVLPYPGIMPGNKLYFISDLYDNFKNYYAFGDFAQFKHNLSQSDKYLVEAKTLFEYSQYPLAIRSLNKSDEFFKKSFKDLGTAQKNKKNINEKKETYIRAREKHIEVLKKLEAELPESFIWKDEKMPEVKINTRREINESLSTRNNL